jgi:outer membrane protein insertion porin family
MALYACILYGQTKKFELTKIEYTGNHSISSSELNLKILSKESPNWISQLVNKISSFGGKAVYFDSLLIPKDISIIKGYYQSKGFFKARISAHYTLDHEKNQAAVTYIIDESKPAYFKSFTLNGVNGVDQEFKHLIFDYVKVDTSKIYEDNIVEDKKNYLLGFLRDHGYMLVKLDRPPMVVIDTVKNKVDVSLNYDLGKRYLIGDVYATRTGKGAELVDESLIKEIVGIEKGSWYNYYNIQRGQVRLYRTNLFNSAVINSVVSDTVNNVVPLNINTDIGLMYEFSPEIITNNEDNTFNLGFATTLSKKNFFGGARKFTLGASMAAENISEFIKHPSFADSTFLGYYDLRASIEQPFLFGQPINTKLETYYTLQKRKDQYNSNLIGAKLNFDFELPQFTYFTSLNIFFNIERSEYTYKQPYLVSLLSQSYQRDSLFSIIKADSVATKFVSEKLGGKLISRSTNAVVGINLGANKTNDIFFPTRGYTLALLIENNTLPYWISRLINFDLTAPLYFKAVFSTTAYLPVYSANENALGLKFKIGQIFTYSGNKADINLNDRLYAGGSNSVRGWSSRQLVPPSSLFSFTANPTQEDLEAVLARGAATGGFFLVEGSIETRNHLIGRIHSAVFLDYGNTWNSSKELRFDQIAVAAGFGLRYYTDFMPFRIDFAFKIFDPNDRRNIMKKQFWSNIFQFQLGIGEAF